MINEIVNEDIEKNSKKCWKFIGSSRSRSWNGENYYNQQNVTFYSFPTSKAKYLRNSKRIITLSIWLKNLGLVE